MKYSYRIKHKFLNTSVPQPKYNAQMLMRNNSQ